ncbi:hypothetical protein YH65_04900 [Sulfurovum lithotrophicum]|uniref:DUF2231 domain-containing protein n=1 Tax=Sulfurovum lithotrophicum TaxID=206403 RepID=A0A7U4M0U4_9BACT|nr:DUF2231 domain-containing protein [Sulfurovum lithotrophicum]AKF24794.1 hypothetical protein YH65_04900 [Sulfurovum lithotrophicum]
MNVLHPPFVHFVIALPLAALFSQLTYVASGNKTYSNAALRIMAFALLVSFFAVFSGILDAKKIVDGHNILQNGLLVLQEHRTFGFVVVAILFATTLIKWIALSKDSLTLEKLSILLIILSIAASLYQGKKGGSLIYKYAGGIDKQIIMKRVAEQKGE